MQGQDLYSEQLIVRTQTYFAQKYGFMLSVEEAVDYLNSLADLYEVFIDFVIDQ
jgi:hypothetical protein